MSEFTADEIVDKVIEFGLSFPGNMPWATEVVKFADDFADFYLDHAKEFGAVPIEFEWTGVNGELYEITDPAKIIAAVLSLEGTDWFADEPHKIREASHLVALSFACDHGMAP